MECVKNEKVGLAGEANTVYGRARDNVEGTETLEAPTISRMRMRI
ncbi:MAG: hypothetical protein RLZZ543_2272 [Bacteroidota bacterium]